MDPVDLTVQLAELKAAVREMRMLQNRYFKFRDKETLIQSKRAERIVDDLVAMAVTG